jgi:hypothetical protein
MHRRCVPTRCPSLLYPAPAKTWKMSILLTQPAPDAPSVELCVCNTPDQRPSNIENTALGKKVEKCAFYAAF